MSHVRSRTRRPAWSTATCAALLALPGLCAAARLEGRVLDESGRPLEGVHIQLESAPTGTATDAKGGFRLTTPGEGPALLRVSRVGYATVRVEAVEGRPCEIRLLPSLLEGAPVTVTATRTSGAVPHVNLDREELELRHHGQDLSRLLDGTPSLVSMSYSGTAMGYNEIRLRGFDAKRVEVLVNGIPVNDPEDHYVYWVDLPDLGASLRDVQVQRGTGTGHFGGSNLGGSINLLTDLGEEPGLRLEAGAGSLGTWRRSLGWSSGVVDGRWQMDARWSDLATDGFRRRSGTEMWGAYLAARRFWQGGALRLAHHTGHELTHTAWNGVPLAILRGWHGQTKDRRQNDDAVYGNSVDDFRQPHSEAQLLLDLPDGSRLDATLFHVDGSGFYETWKPGSDPVAFGLPALDDDGALDLVVRRWIDKRQSGLALYHHRKWAGGELGLGLSGYSYSGQHFGEVVWANRLPEGALPGGRYYTHDAEKGKAGLLATWTRPWGGDWSATATLALQHSRYALRQRPGGSFQGGLLNRFEDAHLFLNPALSVAWAPREELRAFASLSATGREPSRSEYWDAWQGPDDLGVRPLFQQADTLADGSLEWSDARVKPERMLDLELGGEWRGPRHQVKLNLYAMLLRDEITAFGGMDEESPVRGNAPRSHHAGIELDGRLRLWRGLGTGGNLTLSRSRIDELVLHETRYGADWTPTVAERDMGGNPAALSPEVVANLWLDWRPLGGLVVRPRLRHIGQQHLDTSGDDGFLALDPALVDPAFLDGEGGPRHAKTLEAATVLGLDARWSRPLPGDQELVFSLQVENLLDAEYETGGYWNDWVDTNGDWLYEPQPVLYPAAGRQVLLGLAWNL
jgi:iron complex outermembrane receptor protein